MNHIFHLFTIAFILYEISWLIEPLEKTARRKREDEIRKANKDENKKPWGEWSPEYKSLFNKTILKSVMLFWLFGGLFSFNWVGFLALIVWSMAIVPPIAKLTKFSFAYTVLHWVNALIGAAFGIFVILNSYHLRIDLLELVKAWFV